MEESCYHCGSHMPENVALTVTHGQVAYPVCCGGCQAVAQVIIDAGLSDYYRLREEPSGEPAVQSPEILRSLRLFERPDMQSEFVKPVGEHECEAWLMLEGVSCAACCWLTEQHVTRLDGVTAVDANYVMHRVRVRWDQRRLALPAILSAISDIGYRAYPYHPERTESQAKQERRTALWRLAVAALGMMQIMMLALPVYFAEIGTMAEDIEQLMRWGSLLLVLPVVGYSAGPFFAAAWRNVRNRHIGMDVPIALGIGTAFVASLWATFRGTGVVYYDSISMFVFLLLCGRYLEMLARQQAARGIESVSRAVPAFADRYVAYPASETEMVPVTALTCGDFVCVRPGGTVPADGAVIDGESQIDESLLTGESRPIPKRCGDAVTGGSVNMASPLAIRVERVGEQTRVASIVRLMERAISEKPMLVRSADRVAGWFVLAVITVAVFTAIAWLFIDPEKALWIFVSVLVVSCPCALSLATPVSLTVAIGRIARKGFLVSRGHTLETLARATCFVFDKTGTLTQGKLVLTKVETLRHLKREEVLRCAAALEQASEHVIGQCLTAAYAGVLPDVQNIRTTTGAGVEGWVEGRRLRIGTADFVAALHGKPILSLSDDGKSTVFLGDAQGWLACFYFADVLRPEVPGMIAGLRAAGLKILICSGDSKTAVEAVAQRAGIETFYSECSPEEKYARILALQSAGHVVAMVGDGVNDAAGLAQAQVSIAMGGGADLARTQADAVLLSDSLMPLLSAYVCARRTLKVIAQNLRWALAYNILALPLAMCGWVTPWMAGVGMSCSSLIVVANALRLRREDDGVESSDHAKPTLHPALLPRM